MHPDQQRPDPLQRLAVVTGRSDPAHDDPTPDDRDSRAGPVTGPATGMSAWDSWVEETARPPDPVAPPAGARWWGVLRGARIDPSRRGAALLAIAALVAAGFAASLVWSGRPQAQPIAALPVVSVAESLPSASAAATSASAAPAALVVSVAGKVVRPGLVTVPDGARVADVLAAAGGPVAGVDITQLNLARRVADGEQIAVGVPAAPDAVPGGSAAPAADAAAGGAAGAGQGAPIDLNTATVAQLDTLPGVGPVTAERIVEWRTRNGRFARVEQLREVDGIGERRFEQIRPMVRV